MNYNDCWFGEVFKGLKARFWARSYTFVWLARTIFLTAFLLFTNNYQDNLLKLASSKVYYLFLVQLVYIIMIWIMRPLEKAEANLILFINESSFLILCWLLIHYNTESKWNNTMINTFQYIITTNSMVVALIVIGKC